MKKILTFLIVCLLPVAVIAQVNFENISFEEALKRAKQTGKLIFLQFESNTCNQCNEVAVKGLSNLELSNLLQESFICINIDRDHPDRDRVARLYNKKTGFGSLFISGDGNLVHHYGGSSTRVKTYQDQIDKALTKAGEGMKLAELEKQYNAGNKSPDFLEILMQTRKNLIQSTDELLDEYVRNLPPDSFRSIRTLKFIASMSPILGSHADTKLREDVSLYKQLLKSLNPPDFVAFILRTGSKSMAKAIAEKNESYALLVAAFMKATFPGGSLGGQRIADEKMIAYYSGVGDTSNYLAKASTYFDQYIMSVSVAEIKKKDSIALKNLLDKQPQPPPPVPAINGTVIRQTVNFSPSIQIYNRQLNEAAHRFYELTDDPVYLAKALTWSARANEYYAHYISLHTHALLLSKTGDKPGAIAFMQKAIAEKKKQGFETKSLEKDLEKIEKEKL